MDLLQIHPTTRCNYNCSYCSYRNEDKSLALDIDVAAKYLFDAYELGCKAVKITGGGEPLSYDSILVLMLTAKWYKMKIHLQTNGSLLSSIHRKFCDDIRVSFGDGVEFKPTKVDGYSYIVTNEPDYDNLNKLLRYAIANRQYVRITQDETDIDNVPDINDIKGHLPEYELITFWDAKKYHRGANPCPSLLSPVIGADGYIYPCCRFQYAKEVMWKYNKSMRIGQDLNDVQYDGSKCIRCYYNKCKTSSTTKPVTGPEEPV